MTLENPISLSVFRAIRVGETEAEVPLGNVPAETGETIKQDAYKVTIVDIIEANSRVRRIKAVQLTTERDNKPRTVSLGRKTVAGYQTINTGDRVGIRVMR